MSIDIEKLFENDNKLCRICLKSSLNTICIMELTSYSTPRKTYAAVIQDIAKLERLEENSHRMPQQMCSSCCHDLQVAYEFVQRARESELSLSKMFHTQTTTPHMMYENESANIDVLNMEKLPMHFENVSDSSPDQVFWDIILDNTNGDQEETITHHTDTEVAKKDTNLLDKYAKTKTLPVENCDHDYDDREFVVDYRLDESMLAAASNLLEINPQNAQQMNATERDGMLDSKEIKSEQLEFLPVDVMDQQLKTAEPITHYKCDLCPRQYNTKNSYKYHLLHKHQIVYKDPQAKRQRRTAPKSHKTVIKCRSCDYIAKSYSTLNYHTHAKHGSQDDKIKCTFCSFQHIKKFNVKAHIKKHHLPLLKTLRKTLESTSEIEQINVDVVDDNTNYSSGDDELIVHILDMKIKNNKPKKYDRQQIMPILTPQIEQMAALIKSNEEKIKPDSSSDDDNEEPDMLHLITKELENTQTEDNTNLDEILGTIQEEHAYTHLLADTPCLESLNCRNVDANTVRKLKRPQKLKKKSIRCKLCNYKANTRTAAHYHKRSVHGTENDKIKCVFCSYTSIRKGNLFIHVRKVHLATIKALKTSKISSDNGMMDPLWLNNFTSTNLATAENSAENRDESYSSGDEELIRDIIDMKKRGKDFTKTPVLRCGECGYKFKDYPSLGIHKRVFHSEPKYKCQHCNKRYHRYSGLNYHILHFHTPNFIDPTRTAKIHKCPTCSKAFRSRESLNRHTLVHNDIKPYQCRECNKGFMKKHNFKVHSRIHMNQQDVKCSICDIYFIDETELSIHQITQCRLSEMD